MMIEKQSRSPSAKKKGPTINAKAKKQQVKVAYHNEYEAAVGLLQSIRGHLGDTRTADPNWGHVGSLAHVVEELETIALFLGVEEV